MPTLAVKQLEKTTDLLKLQRDGKIVLDRNHEIPGVDTRGWLFVGGKGSAGSLFVKSPDDKTRGWFNTAGVELFQDQGLRASMRSDGRLILGGSGARGKVELRDAKDKATVVAEAHHGNLRLGGEGQHGDLFLYDSKGRQTAHLSGRYGLLTLGQKGSDGDLHICDHEGRKAFMIDGNRAEVFVGVTGKAGKLHLRDKAGRKTLTLDGQKGDIAFANADCAEEFPVARGESLAPGMVAVVDDEGRIHASRDAYDRRVAGVVSGVGELKPAITLGRREGEGERAPIALVGQVHCRADAERGPIEVGDLLVTSPTPGHAMVTHDPRRAFGAVLGKALEPLDHGRGSVRILVALQ